MITPAEWASLLYLKPSDFKRPDGLSFDIVVALDHFIGIIGNRPVILSDYRPGDAKTHGAGLAVDTTWPGVDPLMVHQKAMNFEGFTGVGIYLNELGVTSFRFDARKQTRRDIGPDRWGAIISHPLDDQSGVHVRRTEYVAADVVLDILKKKGTQATIFLIAFGLMIYKLMRR